MNFERQDVQRVRGSNRVLDAEQIKCAPVTRGRECASSCLGEFFLAYGRATSQDFRAAQEQQACSICCKGARVCLSKVP